MAVHEAGLALGGAHGGDAGLFEPPGDPEFPLGPVEQFGGGAPDLDDEIAGGEHRVLTEGDQLGLARHHRRSRRAQYTPRLCLVHPVPPAPITRIADSLAFALAKACARAAQLLDVSRSHQHDDGGRQGGRTHTSRPKEPIP